MATEKLFHVLAISGSLRKASYNTALLRVAAEILPPGMMLETLDLSPLAMFNQDYEKPFPEAVAHLRAREIRSKVPESRRPLVTATTAARRGPNVSRLRRACHTLSAELGRFVLTMAFIL